MASAGTIIDGQVKLDGPIHRPDGTPVTITQRPDRPAYDGEAELAGLREAIDDVRAGRVFPAEQVLLELAARHNLPFPGED